MNYYGWMLKDTPTHGFTETLRAALMKVSTEAPFRGPEQFCNGPWTFRRHQEGIVSAFSGIEEILYEDDLIYRLHFHGGRIE